MPDLLARLLARLGDTEVARLTRERDQARADRDKAARAAVRHRVDAMVQQARADALATKVGRCGQRLDGAFGTRPQTCALLAEHPGWHRADSGTEWGPLNDNTKEQHG